jgi:hypothetical protein
LPAGANSEELIKRPVLYQIEYRDGLKASIFMASGPVREFCVAWKYAGGETQSTCFWLQDGRPFMHFTYLLKGVEQMLNSGRPTWPAERTLMTSGQLDAALQSKQRGGVVVETPYLNITYQSDWNWQMPPAPPTTRPTAGP